MATNKAATDMARISGLGRLAQIAIVPRDFDQTIRFWTEQMGVGPFFVMEHLPYQDVLYRGKPVSIDVSIALANWGEVQIEIIRQHNEDVVSGYTESNPARRDGLHHVLIDIGDRDVEDAHRACLAKGGETLMTGHVPGAGRFIYVDMGDGGPHVEFAELTPRFGEALFGYIADAARDWDGKDPIRSLPDESVWNPSNLS